MTEMLCVRERQIRTSAQSSSRLLMKAQQLKGAACGWLSKGNSSTKSGHAESMEESGKVTLCEGKGQLPSCLGSVLFLLLALL